MKLRRLTLSAVLAAAALIMFVIESQIPPLTAVPGVKLGLANIAAVFALYTVGPWYALAIVLTRVVLGGLLTGQVGAMLYSLAGSLAAWCISWLLSRRLGRERMWVVSVLGAMVHNTAQLGCAMLITRTPELLWYLPVLLLSAMAAGTFTGLTAQLLLRRLRAMGALREEASGLENE